MRIKITKKTKIGLMLNALGNPKGFNTEGIDGYTVIELDQDVINRLVELGADLENPESLEKVILEYC